MRRASASASSRSRRARRAAATTARRCRGSSAPTARWSLLRASSSAGCASSEPHRLRAPWRGRRAGTRARAARWPAAGRSSRRRSSGTVAASRSATAMCVRALVEQAVVQARRGEGERQLRIALGRVGRERGQQRAERRLAAVEDEVDVVVGEQRARRAASRARPARGGSPRPRSRAPRTTAPPRGAASRRAPGRSAAARAAAGRRTGGGSETTIRPTSSEVTNAFASSRPCRIASEPEPPVRASASGPLTRSRTDVRSSSSRTSGGWRSSTSASR